MPQELDKTSPEDGSSADNSQGLRPDVEMHRAINRLENSDLYKNADAKKKIAFQKHVFTQYVIPARAVTDSANLSLKDYIKGRFSGNKNMFAEDTPKTIKAGGAVAHGLTTIAEAAYGAYQKGDEEYNKARAEHLSKTPYEGPFKLDKPTAVKHGSEDIEQFFRNDKNWMESRYKTTGDKVIGAAGTIVGQTPAFNLASGFVKNLGLRAFLSDTFSSALSGRAQAITKLASSMLTHASEGFIVGEAIHDDPVATAIGFGVLGPIGEKLFSPLERFTGKVKVVGGDKLLSQTVAHGKDAIEKGGIESTISSEIINKVGTPKQKITAATVKMLNELVGEGGWAKATPEARTEAIKKLASIAPESNDQLAVIAPEVFQARVNSETSKWRQGVPEADKVLTQLEQLSGKPTAQSITESVGKKEIARKMVNNPQAIIDSVGAAKAGSPEFEEPFSRGLDDKLSKLGFGKDKIVFEDRGHKLLFYLNLLMAQAKEKGMSKASNKEFNLLLNHLNERYKDKTFPELVQMSDNVWTKMEQLTKAGHMKEGAGPVRFFRQSEIRPGESPFGHEVWLAREAAAADKISELQKAPIQDLGDPSASPTGKDRRSTIRVNLNDPDSVRELIDMHDIRIKQLRKELLKKELTNEERSEIQEAIEIEGRKKTEQKSHLGEITQEKIKPVEKKPEPSFANMNFDKDNQAYAEAKKRLGPNADPSAVANLAQLIKKGMK